MAEMAGVVVNGTQVSYIGQDCKDIPEFLGRQYGYIAKRLDLSFNLLRWFAEAKAAYDSLLEVSPVKPMAEFRRTQDWFHKTALVNAASVVSDSI
ncbi:leucine-rich melanocyte differentiation-associated protein-like [Hemicordylus capensis]|uniref:leucine-rich melanocyte differentiation-associated protein-like n=1 Tax=Hemicordylus capensis TaxID=884348 RepID=UPI002303D9BF|nr:leucine-rich melanocyte differentiation-associated protein-like [Hemicordylus capensis]